MHQMVTTIFRSTNNFGKDDRILEKDTNYLKLPEQQNNYYFRLFSYHHLPSLDQSSQ